MSRYARLIPIIAIALGSTASGFDVAHGGSKYVPPTPVPPRRVLTPGYSLIEWFSDPRPVPGQVDVVHTRLWSKNRPIAGARLTGTVKDGKHVVRVVVGGTTNRQGEAEARFVVPRLPHGRRLQVLVTMQFRGRTVTGSNTLTIR